MNNDTSAHFRAEWQHRSLIASTSGTDNLLHDLRGRVMDIDSIEKKWQSRQNRHGLQSGGTRTATIPPGLLYKATVFLPSHQHGSRTIYSDSATPEKVGRNAALKCTEFHIVSPFKKVFCSYATTWREGDLMDTEISACKTGNSCI